MGWINRYYGTMIDPNGYFLAAGGMYKAPSGMRGYVWVNETQAQLICQFRPGIAIYSKTACLHHGPQSAIVLAPEPAPEQISEPSRIDAPEQGKVRKPHGRKKLGANQGPEKI